MNRERASVYAVGSVEGVQPYAGDGTPVPGAPDRSSGGPFAPLQVGAHPEGGDAPLTGRELLVLQLLARGYAWEQMPKLVDDVEAATGDALSAAARLAAPDIDSAVRIAVARGLII